VTETPWVVGTPPALPIAEGLGADLHELPTVVLDPEWSQGPIIEEWRDRARSGPQVTRAVVAVWPETPVPSSVVDLDLDAWTARMETGFALWFAALSVACHRCVDGGQVVAVTDRPEAKASAGWALESAVADAVEVLARSLVQVERRRGVRVNVVSTSARLRGAPPSSWAEVVGAVGMLLNGGGAGVNAAVIRVGSGW
jgi:NAD(P)-dependent dehydrogenase (short-subunit alcohol dehydrogenase family)